MRLNGDIIETSEKKTLSDFICVDIKVVYIQKKISLNAFPKIKKVCI